MILLYIGVEVFVVPCYILKLTFGSYGFVDLQSAVHSPNRSGHEQVSDTVHCNVYTMAPMFNVSDVL
jgi:hypothetical protein